MRVTTATDAICDKKFFPSLSVTCTENREVSSQKLLESKKQK